MDLVVYIFNPNIQEAEAGGSLGVQDQPRLPRKFQANHTVRICLRKKNQNNKHDVHMHTLMLT